MSKTKVYSRTPTLLEDTYRDIINVINVQGKACEQKPSTYRGKTEEDLRDLFLMLLEPRYESLTATGETFNKDGKTDMLIKHTDGTNVFIGECKVWHGAKQFHAAIDQLFNRYLTWRDSRVALIFFVPNSNFSEVISTFKTEVVQHQYYKSGGAKTHESSYSYKFHLPGDKDQIVHTEFIFFHFKKE